MRTDRYILDADGEPQPCEDLLTWARWYETADRRVAQDMDEGVPDDADPVTRIRVSTVFLALDHSFGFGASPVLWETMVFGGVLDGETSRYTSKAAALVGHQRMCERVRKTIIR